MEQNNNYPIGVFDSGVGGLTVVKELIRQLPNENIIYVGDTAHVPYGTKSARKVTVLSTAITNFLVKQKVKLIIVACNTASALALPSLKHKFKKLSIIGVIEPGASEAVKLTKTKRIGVIATPSTIKSCSYTKEIKNLYAGVSVYSQPCPLFVPIAEEGLGKSDIAYLAAKRYLTPLISKNIDVLVLGCTHYPLLKKTISNVIGKKVVLIDSADAIAKAVKVLLEEKNVGNASAVKKWQHFFVTDDPAKFMVLGSKFLNKKISSVKLIDLDKYT